ncbi:hypothetical protein [Riemerella anatipestifer]|uniref:hypothetical protein n=1 Tax=Riemerella anatipestifer TaxID=34085 RepID=UPI0002AB2CAF|nr:hypothetical protein [Riemerella anatipestifer]AGC39498.1 hypothetical protein G148_0193 [Riemerella anatipestifer RA-CH-2]MCU7574275.1 hypothetical protein [Riemerella anatipestifer]MCU7595440.1 hypothetical protein [Riemerella anatipestifer]MCW0477802.1 hypothetical protein [Riemerella anatipestifer]MCW0497818.1 hypothetical protein [Riemerella anatipestifer]
MKTERIDLTLLIENKVKRKALKLVMKWLSVKGIKKLEKEKISISYEKVPNYSISIYTIRYEGDLVLRRYSEDLEGLKYRFEINY